jgi:hypothetical protein
MTYFLKNTSGARVDVKDLGIVLAHNTSLVIDSNGIPGWLTPELAGKLNTPSELILSTTDVGDNSGDMTPALAIKALTLISRADTDNPTSVTFTQVAIADPNTDITAAEAEELTNGSDTALHIHDGRYYTKTQLQTGGTSQVNWANITNAPTFGAPQWQMPAKARATISTSAPASPVSGQFYLNSTSNHLFKFVGSAWVDQGAPSAGLRFIDIATDKIYQWSGTAWVTTDPEAEWSIMVQDDGDGKASQYIFDGVDWIKIADVDWALHNGIGGRNAADTHPAASISFDKSLAPSLTATNVQDALQELAQEGGVEIDELFIVAKNGSNTAPNVILGSYANPYLTIQAAINAVPTTGIDSASSTKRYGILVMPGTYVENVVLSKDWVYVFGADVTTTVISSNSGNTLTLNGTLVKSTGVCNIILESSSSNGIDAALLCSGNTPVIQNMSLVAPTAQPLYVSGSSAYQFTHVMTNGGISRIDSGTVDFYDFRAEDSSLSIVNGSVTIHSGYLQNDNADVITQSGGSIRFIFGRIVPTGANKSINQTSGTAYWGWVDTTESKCTFGGTKVLIFAASNLSYINTTSGLTATTVQGAIDQLDNTLDSAGNALALHLADHTNPHVTTFTQASIADPNTDITAAEAETLTNGSNADVLHIHSAAAVTYNKLVVSELDRTNVQDAIDFIAKYYKTNMKNVIYVGKNGSDVTLNNGLRGSFGAPYLTIQAALNRIEMNNDNAVNNPYVVVVAPGVYAENLLVNDVSYFSIIVHGYGASVAPSSGRALESSLTNTNLQKLRFVGLDFQKDFYVEGYANNSNILSVGLQLEDCTLAANVTVKNVVALELKDVAISGILSVENVNDVKLDGLAITNSQIQLDYNTANNRPLGSSQTHVTIINSQIKSDIAVHQNVLLELFDCGIGNGNKTITNDGTLIAHSGWIYGSIQNHAGGTFITRGAFFDKTKLSNSGVVTNETHSSVVEYNNSITAIPADNVQDAIDNLKARIDAFKMPQGTSFPPAPAGGDLFYRSDLRISYQYDLSRNKWLSITELFLDYGASNADGKYLNIHGATATMTGYLMPRAGTIVALTVKIASGNLNKQLEIRRNNDGVTPLKAFTASGGTFSSVVENIDFDAGDYIQAFTPSSGVGARDIVVVATICWR